MPWGVIPSISVNSLYLTLSALTQFRICKTKRAVYRERPAILTLSLLPEALMVSEG